MRHRLYYLLPDVDSARRTLDDMLLQRIEERCIHFLSDGAPLPDDLPEGNFLHRTDVMHGARAGMLGGAAIGFVLGFIISYYYNLSASGALVVVALSAAGLLFGGWAASMMAAALPNTQLKEFYSEMEQGRILMIADVPAGRIAQVEAMLASRHPEIRFGGEDGHVPVFP